jgi:aryl-alcohol dehydrogenase-like predicted oxidoreductase
VFDHLRKIQSEGLIRHFGVSVETAEEALICLEHKDVASLQIIFNLFRQHLADIFFEKAQRQRVALIARVPLASGLLSGRFGAQTKFATNDHRNYNADGAAFNVGETFSGVPFKMDTGPPCYYNGYSRRHQSVAGYQQCVSVCIATY